MITSTKEGFMELLDLYDEDRNKLEKTYLRGSGDLLNDNEFILGVDVWIKNDKNKILLTQRHHLKRTFPLKWECTSGMVGTGEDSITAALREAEEEIGIKLQKHDGKLLTTITFMNYLKKNYNMILDVFLFEKNIDLNHTNLQEGEVINIKWVDKCELIEMFKNKEMVEPMNYILELLKDGLIENIFVLIKNKGAFL